jgi:NlpC/P60 family putative phage cell wall peptidase
MDGVVASASPEEELLHSGAPKANPESRGVALNERTRSVESSPLGSGSAPRAVRNDAEIEVATEHDFISRASIAAAARAWIGTPYQHQASAKGAGCDCLGLVRGVWREFFGEEPEPTPAYTPDWCDRGPEALFHAARRHLHQIAIDECRRGDVLLFRMQPGAPMKHAAILVESGKIVHAYWGRAVVESRLSPWWRTRIGAAFQFPRIDPWRS